MSDEIQELVQEFRESVIYDADSKRIPLATDDAEKVIKAQLTENTGAHLLDSGSAYGRHWEENQENPPWERPEWNVSRDFVTRNVYHFMERRLGRDRFCVALETALYAFGYTDEWSNEAWLRTEEAFAEKALGGEFTTPQLEALGVPLGFAEDMAHGVDAREPGPMTHNTYNSEFGSNSQILQGVNLGGPYSEYVLMQVHQGCDVRGGYTAPRVYQTWDGWIPMEFSLDCENCGWHDMESCVYGSDDLLYQRSIDPFELEDEGLLDEGDEEHPALEAAYEAEEKGWVDGAIFHKCSDDEFGYVRVA